MHDYIYNSETDTMDYISPEILEDIALSINVSAYFTISTEDRLQEWEYVKKRYHLTDKQLQRCKEYFLNKVHGQGLAGTLRKEKKRDKTNDI